MSASQFPHGHLQLEVLGVGRPTPMFTVGKGDDLISTPETAQSFAAGVVVEFRDGMHVHESR